MNQATTIHASNWHESLRNLRLGRTSLIGAALGAAMLCAGASVLWQNQAASQAQAAARVQKAEMRSLILSTTGEQGAILSKGDSAEERNSLIPLSKLPVEHARAFDSIAAGTPAYAAALKCLTQAVYYEAATEPLEGKRAVAQVVLNRVRHPAYPNSVCGVVYEGVNKPVCQFSFTCDGSLLRAPMASYWEVSRKVAAAALGGYVEASVGSATHYHADYVVPRWAYTLGKIDQLGRHIFYRFKGNAGDASFLSARWSGHESIPALDYGRLRRELLAHENTIATEEFVPGLTVTPAATDRHAATDVGGRIDVTKQWRLSIPDPTEASQNYRALVEGQRETGELASVGGTPSI